MTNSNSRTNFFSLTLKTGFAIFAMLFGSGNLIYPIRLGILSGNQTWLGLIGFALSGILLPLAGLVGMVFFDGDYKAFFYRLGKIPGALLIVFAMLIIGPLLVMPRIMGVSYELIEPSIGGILSQFQFSIIFAIITFILAYKKNSLIEIIGKVLSPIKIATLAIIVIFGLWTAKTAEVVSTPWWKILTDNIELGYYTLDLLGSIFFAHIILNVLQSRGGEDVTGKRKIAKIMLYASAIGGFLLFVIYAGMSFIGAFHGQGLSNLAKGKMFTVTLLRVLGEKGTFFMGLTVFVACLTTLIALSSVVSEYLWLHVFNKRFNYVAILALVLALAAFISRFSLDKLLTLTEPLINILYPVFIVLTLCNIAYKLWNFKPVKIPALLTLIFAIYWYGPAYLELLRSSF